MSSIVPARVHVPRQPLAHVAHSADGALPAPPARRRRRTSTLALANPERHAPGIRKERPPRPLGVSPGMPWEPREPVRSPAFQNITIEFLEFLDRAPKLQTIAARAIGILFRGGTRSDTPLPTDVDDEPGSWRFGAIGDYGAGTVHQARVAANMLRFRPELVVTAGDNVYPTGRWEDYEKNWDPPHLMGTLARNTVFMPALGNHDMYRDDLRPYFGHFPHLEGRPYYSFTHKNASFFALDSDQDLRVGSAQYRWLEQALRSATTPWKVVYLHYPMYGRDPNAYREIREAVQPLLAKYGVQLVIAGHEHNYQRSHAIDGVTHILTGGGGQQVFPFTQRQPGHIARRASAFHHVEVSVGASRLTVRAVDEFGRRIDTAVIRLQGPVDAQAGAEQIRQRRRARGASPVPPSAGVAGAAR
jgi:hypothetical protein